MFGMHGYFKAQPGKGEELAAILLEAAEALDCSSFVRNAFGDEFVDIFVNQKIKEWDSQFYSVPVSEREKCMTNL